MIFSPMRPWDLVETTRKSVHELGFEVVTKKKGTFVDGHEREDVVEYRKTYCVDPKNNSKKTLLGIQTHVCGFQTQGTKPLGHRNWKWLLILSILACFTGKTVELRNAVCFKELFQN